MEECYSECGRKDTVIVLVAVAAVMVMGVGGGQRRACLHGPSYIYVVPSLLEQL